MVCKVLKLVGSLAACACLYCTDQAPAAENMVGSVHEHGIVAQPCDVSDTAGSSSTLEGFGLWLTCRHVVAFSVDYFSHFYWSRTTRWCSCGGLGRQWRQAAVPCVIS